MLEIFFGAITTGRLERLPFVGYNLLLILVGILISFGLFAILGTPEGAAAQGRDLQALLQEQMGWPLMGLFMILGLAFTFASLNLSAKRFRDMGLPGWWTLLGALALQLLISSLFPGQVVMVDGLQEVRSSGPEALFQLLLLLVLIFTPSDFFGSSSPAPRS